MIEKIPKDIRPFLNEFVIKGKRSYLQAKNLFTPMYKEICKLNDRMLDAIAFTSTEHFTIKIDEDDGRGHRSGKIVVTSGYKGRWPHIIYIEFFRCVKSQNFDKAFAITKLNQNSFHIPIEPLQNEYDNLLNTIKKKVALDFFTFVKLGNHYNRLANVYDKKREDLNDLATAIENLWKEKYRLKRGMEVTYKELGHGNKSRTGTVTHLSSYTSYVYDYTKEYVGIRSSANREIYRVKQECLWKNKFEDTRLSECIKMILDNKGIPEEWLEKRLDFYV